MNHNHRLQNINTASNGAIVVHTYWYHDSPDRAEFRTMINVTREDNVDAIIAQFICRFVPSSAECLRVIRDLHEHNIRVWFSRKRFWSNELTGYIMMMIIQELADVDTTLFIHKYACCNRHAAFCILFLELIYRHKIQRSETP